MIKKTKSKILPAILDNLKQLDTRGSWTLITFYLQIQLGLSKFPANKNEKAFSHTLLVFVKRGNSNAMRNAKLLQHCDSLTGPEDP